MNLDKIEQRIKAAKLRDEQDAYLLLRMVHYAGIKTVAGREALERVAMLHRRYTRTLKRNLEREAQKEVA